MGKDFNYTNCNYYLSSKVKLVYLWYTGGSSSENWRINVAGFIPVTLIIPVMCFEKTHRYSNAEKGIMLTVVI